MDNQSKFHVLIIPSWYTTKENPINGIFFKEQSEALAKFDVNVGLVYAETEKSLKKINFKNIKNNHFQIEKSYINKVLIYRYKGWRIPPKVRNLQIKYWINKMVRLAENYIKENGRPDIIHAHSALWGGYVAYILSMKYKIPYVITEHSSLYARKLIPNYDMNFAKIAFKNANTIIAVSKSFKNLISELIGIRPDDIITIPNMVSTNYFTIKENKNNKVFTFLTVCFLTYNKGIETLILAFNKAFKNVNNVKLIIGGDGEQKDYLLELVMKLKLQDKIEFLGLLSRDKVKLKMQNANCFVLPSYYETFGVVLIEALSTGCPVIGTKCGGPNDIINNKVGLLIESRNVDQLTYALKYMYKNFKNYKSDYIRNYTIKNYSEEVVTSKIIDVYKNILHKI